MTESSFLLPEGTRLVSPSNVYVIDRVLGHGGFGVTYLAHYEDRPTIKIAIKEHFVKTLCSRDEHSTRVIYFKHITDRYMASKRDFITEACRLQRQNVSHPNIVQVGEVFEQNDTAYYVMEYLEGQSLTSYVEARGHLGEQEMLAIMKPVIDAVGFLHRNRLTHLDIKPDNIMMAVDASGSARPVLIDFGLAKHYDEKGEATSTINTLGVSDGYAPHEQYAGISKFSPTADIYALGATMLFCLTGQRPPKASANSNDLMASLIPQDVSDNTYRAMCYALDWDKDSRTESISQMNDDLAGIVHPGCGETVGVSKPRRSSSGWIVAALVVLSGLVVALGYIVYEREKSVEPANDVVTESTEVEATDTVAAAEPEPAPDPDSFTTPDLVFNEVHGPVKSITNYDISHAIIGEVIRFDREGRWLNPGNVSRNDAGEIIRLTVPDEGTINYQWKDGRITGFVQDGNRSVFSYSDNGQYASIVTHYTSGEEERAVYVKYAYDSHGNWISREWQLIDDWDSNENRVIEYYE